MLRAIAGFLVMIIAWGCLMTDRGQELYGELVDRVAREVTGIIQRVGDDEVPEGEKVDT
jgi:hypothetical protein